MFAAITERLLHLGFYDTQCGIKLMRAGCLRSLLPVLVEDRWMLDVEMLALMKARGARFLEVPIDWTDAGTSKVRFGIDQFRMLWSLGRIRRRVRRDRREGVAGGARHRGAASGNHTSFHGG